MKIWALSRGGGRRVGLAAAKPNFDLISLIMLQGKSKDSANGDTVKNLRGSDQASLNHS